jgi:DNA polymerase III subunit delta'
MQFAEVVGQLETKKNLLQLVADKRIPHATLLQGQPGSGTLPLTIAFATYIMCEAPLANDSCGACPNCAKMRKLMHPDVHYSYPVVNDKDKGEPVSASFIKDFRAGFTNNPYMNGFAWIQSLDAGNKQGNITAKETREIIKTLTLKSFEGGYKILIMWLPEYLGKEGNQLLKLIEEPPINTIFLLATESPDHILATIKSRTQLINLHPLSDKEIMSALIAQGTDEKMAAPIARLCEGDYFEALQIANHSQENYFDLLKNWLNCLFTNNGIALTDWVMSMSDLGREKQKQFLLYFINMLEHFTRTKYGAKHNLLLQAEELSMIEKFIQIKINDKQVEDISLILNKAAYHIEGNLNGKIVFHAISLEIKTILTKK